MISECTGTGTAQILQNFYTSYILDLVISVYTGTAQVLRNFNTSDYVAILVSFDVQTTDVVYPSACHEFHWSRVPLNKLFHYFDSFKWNISGSVDNASVHASSVIASATEQFIPSCVLKLSCPTPWWNRHCEAAWQTKRKFWHKSDLSNFQHCC